MGHKRDRSSSSESSQYNERLEKRLRRLKRKIKKKKEKKRRLRRKIREASSDSKESLTDYSTTSEVCSEEEREEEKSSEVHADQLIADEKDQPELSEDILSMIGRRVCEDRTLSPAIQPEVALRWQDIIKQGLPDEEKIKVIKKYPPPENCLLCDPPKLNPEVKNIIQESVCNRDKRIALKQSKLTAGLAAIGEIMTPVIKKGLTEENVNILELGSKGLGDTGSLLADLQHDESTIRKSLILANINLASKDALRETQMDEYLFSSKLEDVLKSSKALEAASNNLRPKNRNQSNKFPKNWKTPDRQYRKEYVPTVGRRKQLQKDSMNRRSHSSCQRYRPKKEQQQQYRRRRH